MTLNKQFTINYISENIRQLTEWIQQSPHKGFCSRYNNDKSEHKCGCGRDELIKKVEEEKKSLWEIQHAKGAGS